MAAAAAHGYGGLGRVASEDMEDAWQRVTRSGGALGHVRRSLRRMLRELCDDGAAGVALDWARRVGIERRPLEHWRQQLRDHGVRSIQDFQVWTVKQCGRQMQAEEWAREGMEGDVQEDIEAFGRGE